MIIFIEIYPQIYIFSEFRSKKRAKTTNKDTIAIKRKNVIVCWTQKVDTEKILY
jgi:hypothetical protein